MRSETRRAGTALAAVCLTLAGVPARGQQPRTARVDGLLARMTLDEKIGQLHQVTFGPLAADANDEQKREHAERLAAIRAGQVGSLLGAHGAAFLNETQRAAVAESRLGIPLLFANDIIHGYRTIFPIPLGEAASFDPAGVEAACRVAAREARAAGTHWTFAPMVDVCRDPRWGRIAETAGEDPFLGAQLAAARVRGFQGAALTAPDSVLACAKHFVAYGGAEGGRDYNTVDISLQTLHEIHLPTFQAAVRAGVGSIMTSFNEINGVPASAHPHALQRVLRGAWGFGGIVISDFESIAEMIVHGYAADRADAAARSFAAGVDIDMVSGVYRENLARLIDEGRISTAQLDAAVRRVLEAKVRLGLFEQPYADAQREAATLLAPEHRRLARELAARAIVLLKNDAATLPLKADVASIAVIGPLADRAEDILGTWRGLGKAEEAITVLRGIREGAPAAAVVRYEPGCEVNAESAGGVEAAVKLAAASDAVVLVLGEIQLMSGEGLSRSSVELPPAQRALALAVLNTGRPVAVVLLAGRPLAIPELAERAPAILMAWHGGTEGGSAVADVLFGRVNPGGKLPATFPRSTGQIPVYYNHKNTGRPGVAGERYTSGYIDLPLGPLYPFGFGLSYTRFEFRDLRVSPPTIDGAGAVRVQVDLANVGDRTGDEVVQVYYRDPVASLTRPVRQLCGFRRVRLEPGETRTVEFTIEVSTFGFHDAELNFIVEPGEIQLFAGPDSASGLRTTIQIRENAAPAPASISP